MSYDWSKAAKDELKLLDFINRLAMLRDLADRFRLPRTMRALYYAAQVVGLEWVEARSKLWIKGGSRGKPTRVRRRSARALRRTAK